MPTFRRFVIPVLVLVIVVGGAFAAYQVADSARDSAAQEADTVTNETLVQQVGTWQLVSKSTDEFTAGFNDSVTVYNNSSVELTEGTDYEWNETDGAIKFLDTDSTSDGDPANITYTYFENTQEVKRVAGPLDVIVTGLGKFGYAGGAIALVVFLLAVAAFVAKSWAKGPKTNR